MMNDTTQAHGCAAVQGRLTALLDNELVKDDTAAVQAHLAECAACRQEWESLAATRALAARWPEEDVMDLWPALQAQIVPTLWEEAVAELRVLRAETQTLREEIAQLRRALATRPAPVTERSTPLDLPYVPRVSRSRFQIV